MASHNEDCLGNYDFDQIAMYARKRFIEGVDTVSLMRQASSEKEKEEIALVCLLSVEDDIVKDIQLNCRHARNCKLTDCRDKLRALLEKELTAQ